MWDRRARIVTVKDGDTVRVTLDQGFGDTKTIDLRLLDTFAPEHDEPGGAETTAFATEWVEWNNPDHVDWPFVVTTLRIKADTHEVQTLGRYVGTVRSDDGDTLNAAVRDYVASEGYGHGIGA
jgi:endonuclease YncB( thermonuclease family)